MTHTQRRDFVCPGCNRAFSRNDSMARHLRRKHPHLYRSPETSSSAAAGTGQTYIGAASADASTSTATATFATGGHGILALRSPFGSSFYSNSGNAQRRADDHRTFPDSLGRQSSYSIPYDQEAVPRSPRSNASAQWRDDSRGPDGPAPPHAVASTQDEGMRPHESRPNYPMKLEQPCRTSHGAPSFGSSAFDLVGRSGLIKEASNEQIISVYGSDWTGTANFDHTGSDQAGTSSQFPWEHQEGHAPYLQHTQHTGWQAPQASSYEHTIPTPQLSRREAVRSGYNDNVPSEVPCFAHQVADFQAQTDIAQSEFFVGTMPSRTDPTCWASLDPSMLTTQDAERVLIESALDSGQLCPDISLAAANPSVSPSDASATIAGTYLPIEFRNMRQQAAPVDPPNAQQVERIMADLGIDLGSNQASAINTAHDYSSQSSSARHEHMLTATPLIPSQTAVSAPWTAERFVPSGPSLHPHHLSQNQSSQSSAYLPSLTASQNEYLGPNASSHRRTMDRTWSSASVAFDAASQTRASQLDSQGFGSELDDSLGCQPEVKAAKSDVTATSALKDPNFNKPDDSNPSQRADKVEEGGKRSFRDDTDWGQVTSVPRECCPSHSKSPDAIMTVWQMDGNSRSDSSVPSNIALDHAASSMGPPRRDRVSFAEAAVDPFDPDKMEIDEASLPASGQQQDDPALDSTSAVSGDQLKLVVERFRAFAQLCQDHLRPSSEMLQSSAPYIPQVIRADAPFYHPMMLGAQKTHSLEEAFALLSLASLQSNDSNVKEEAHRLMYFLYGLVMLSYRHTFHLGGKLQSFLNCVLLVEMYGLRQSSPDLWHKLEQNRESILLDVLRVHTQSSALDAAMDQIEPNSLDKLREEELSQLWTRWYGHESWKRTLLLCAIHDSQASSFFSPFKIDLSARPDGPRCQFLFAHVHEPCTDTLFFAWPPTAWANRLVASTSLPQSKSAGAAFRDGKPVSIAACLTEHLLRPHVAHQSSSTATPRFRSSFDFGPSRVDAQSSKHSTSVTDGDIRASSASAGPSVEIEDDLGVSARSSRRESHAGPQDATCEGRNAHSAARVVSQLYMSALLESVHGAWMADSGWYQTPAWGASALSEQLGIDADDFDIENSSLADLPGWRIGRTLQAAQVAHALMNWSEMYSGCKDACRTSGDGAVARHGLKVTDDAHYLTVRWQAIFLGLCAPLQSLCFYLDAGRESSAIDRERRRRIAMLLQIWVNSAYCRRALVHAGTILTLLCAARMGGKEESLGPATSHAAFMSLVVLVSTSMILRELRPSFRSTEATTEHLREELVPVKEAWPALLRAVDRSHEGKLADSMEESDDVGESTQSQEWLRVRFWHRRFQLIGLAGIFREHGEQGSAAGFTDWRASVSGAAGLGSSLGLRRLSHSLPRWSSFAGEERPPNIRRAMFERHHTAGNYRRASHAQFHTPQHDPDRDLLRRHLHTSTASTINASSETRRWILQGKTHHATFCGLSLWNNDGSAVSDDAEDGTLRRDTLATSNVMGCEELRKLVDWVRRGNPRWCFGQEYTDLLLGALNEDPAAAGISSSAESNGQGCSV
ncbi:C2H2 type zinc finger containing protein [Pseudozyma hubeiensis SY62]|uniref:C2H2 type zinc finger containing protein n=1 Tax=Pseudozyma hubeiensis (strain SY62) TaxID=1305764 RepID=R9PCI7_PSEHS|nr:C2H2 type zinc finger containing protein [Pseudozyma hubeiensis SY62]GAC98937.1 C2H2 type zinc finger containing protein [Pseudozyma hubeiensis SY62]